MDAACFHRYTGLGRNERDRSMDTILQDPKLRQKVLDQFGNSTGLCCQIYDFTQKTFYFSANISELTGYPDRCRYSLKEWYDIILDTDRSRVQQYAEDVFRQADAQYSFNYRLRSRRGKLVWVHSKGKYTCDEQGRPLYFLGLLSPWKDLDAQAPRRQEQALLKKLDQLHRQGQDGYLLLVNVDDLSRINLKYGRESGDGILHALAATMRGTDDRFSKPLRTGDSCFCTLALGVDRQAVEHYFSLVQQNMKPQCTLSGGCVSLLEYQVLQSETLLHYAESALDAAKLAGKNRLAFFNPADYERKLADMELQLELEQAVGADCAGFSLVYQPQVESETFSLAGAEALLRFTSPTRGPVEPSEFVPILERTGLLLPVGRWALARALEQCRQWRGQLPHFRVSVNMSYMQLRRPEIQDEVLEQLDRNGLPGSALTIEVTEGIELQEYTYLNTIFSAWKMRGVDISVDDFGTGYSSLSWLKELAIDEIKIDRCFVNDIQHSAYNLRLLSNIIELARSSGLRVCCEGVETEGELAALEQLQPALYQGFFFSRPLSPEKLDPLSLQQELQQRCRSKGRVFSTLAQQSGVELPLEYIILEKTEDAITLCDINTYELYYLNPAARRIFGVSNYKGQKCYKALRGKDAPCDFCPNALLRHDTFYTWEDRNTYCGRHFLMRAKLMDVGGRTLRLQVAMDITRQEYVSQHTRERLEFANRIVGYANLLSRQPDWCETVRTVLASMGEFYKADRAYLFEGTPDQPGCWDNTFEWCAPGVTPQQKTLQQVPPEGVARWMDLFRSQGSVLLYNLEPLRKSFPVEWELLNRQQIQRVISVPLINEGRIQGFIGVDNPRYAIQDDTQARVLASFLMVRFRRERKEWMPEPGLPRQRED